MEKRKTNAIDDNDNDDGRHVEKVAIENIRAKWHGITSLEICAVGDSVLSHHVVQVVLWSIWPLVAKDLGIVVLSSLDFVKSAVHHTNTNKYTYTYTFDGNFSDLTI